MSVGTLFDTFYYVFLPYRRKYNIIVKRKREERTEERRKKIV